MTADLQASTPSTDQATDQAVPTTHQGILDFVQEVADTRGWK